MFRLLHLSHRLAAFALCAAAFPAFGAQVRVAVAANFAAPMKAIAVLFEKTSGHDVEIVTGATGRFRSQIANGAPFDMLLSADAATPLQLEQDGLAVAGTRFTYARGKLALYSTDPALVDDQGAVLRGGRFRKLAIAQPKLAPYGAAAMQAIATLGLQEQLAPKLVQGESIGQAFAFVATGNAELGFVALSQVLETGGGKTGSLWIVPSALYAPIVQDAVLLNRGKDNPAAKALLAFLQTREVRDMIRAAGYGL